MSCLAHNHNHTSTGTYQIVKNISEILLTCENSYMCSNCVDICMYKTDIHTLLMWDSENYYSVIEGKSKHLGFLDV